MLNVQAITTSFALAEQLDAAGVVLMPLAGTPLDHMAQATCATADCIVEGEQHQGGYLIDPFELERRANAIVEPFEQSRHDYVTEETVRVAANSVQNVISVIRNRVAPAIGELVELVKMRMNGMPLSQLAQIQIKTNEGAEAMFNPALARLIEKYELIAPSEPQMNTALPRLSAAEIMPLLETGIASLDANIHEWLANVSPVTLESIWSTFFSVLTAVPADQNDRGYPTVATSQQPFNTLLDGWDCARIVVFLAARNMLENDVVLENTEMNLNQLRGTLQAYMEQSGRQLNRQLEKLSAGVQNGVLVTSLNNTEIVVNTPVYNAWLQNGGENDILFGMAVSGTPTFLVSTINERADEFRQLWHRHSQIISAADSTTRFNYLRTQLVLCYENMLMSEELDGQKLPARQVHAIVEEFKKQLDVLTIAETQDIYQTCLKLVCRTRYPKIPAERFLLKMDEVAKADPALSAKETATIATYEYICDWVASQFVVTAA